MTQQPVTLHAPVMCMWWPPWAPFGSMHVMSSIAPVYGQHPDAAATGWPASLSLPCENTYSTVLLGWLDATDTTLVCLPTFWRDSGRHVCAAVGYVCPFYTCPGMCAPCTRRGAWQAGHAEEGSGSQNLNAAQCGRRTWRAGLHMLESRAGWTHQCRHVLRARVAWRWVAGTGKPRLCRRGRSDVCPSLRKGCCPHVGAPCSPLLPSSCHSRHCMSPMASGCRSAAALVVISLLSKPRAAQAAGHNWIGGVGY